MESSKRHSLESANNELSVPGASIDEPSGDETSINESSDDETSSDESSIDGLRELQKNYITEITCDNENLLMGVLGILQHQQNHSSLEEIYINCEICFDIVVSIAKVLEINKSNITLHIGEGFVCSDGIMAIVEALSDYNNSTSKELVLLDNTINNTAVIVIGRMLKTNNTLAVLEMCNCNIDLDEGIATGDSLKHNMTLERLDLCWNDLEDAGAIAIADGIKENDSLSLNSLDLCQNIIGMIGARSIAAMPSMNKSLTDLDLGYNPIIGTDGVIAIAKALKQNESLTSLDLHDNPCGDDGAKSIGMSLTSNVVVEELYLKNCDIGDSGAAAITDAGKTNKSLELKNLRYNLFTCHVVTNVISPMIEINTALKKLQLGKHTEPIYDSATRASFETLQDYNDAVDVELVENSDNHHDDELELMLCKISDIIVENRQGLRCTSFKRHRDIFNSLKSIWMVMTHDA